MRVYSPLHSNEKCCCQINESKNQGSNCVRTITCESQLGVLSGNLVGFLWNDKPLPVQIKSLMEHKSFGSKMCDNNCYLLGSKGGL